MSEVGKSQRSDENVYGRRKKIRSKARHIVKRGARITRRIFARPLTSDTVFLPYPVVVGAEEMGDFAARTAWYLGSWSRPPSMDGFDVAIPDYLDQSIDIIGTERPVVDESEKHFVVWKVTPRTLLRALLQPARFTIVDASLAKDADRDGYLEIAERLGRGMPSGFASVAPRPRSDVDAQLVTRSSVVLGTGPSASDLQGNHEDWDYRIVCNSAIRDEALMERLRPTHICFGDPVFHAGPSAYAGTFRHDLERVVQRYDSVLVVPAYCAPGLAAHMPWARGKILAVDLRNQDTWSVPQVGDLSVRNTGNVLTQQMLPLAMAISSQIDIGGADGRKPEERYFWAHSVQYQYSDDLMRTVFRAHPAFFRDTDYQDYYEAHCEALESLLAFGESLGCSMRGVTRSYIPALAARLDR